MLIKHYFWRAKTTSETKTKLDRYYFGFASSFRMVHKLFWISLRSYGHNEAVPSPGCSNERTTAEIESEKVRNFAETVRIWIERVHNIWHEHLHIKKLCAKWVPRLLTIDLIHLSDHFQAKFGLLQQQSEGGGDGQSIWVQRKT